MFVSSKTTQASTISASFNAAEVSTLSFKPKATEASAHVSHTTPPAFTQDGAHDSHVAPSTPERLASQVTSVSRASTPGAGLTPSSKAGANVSMSAARFHSTNFTSAAKTSLFHDDDSGHLASHASVDGISMSRVPASHSANDTSANCFSLLDDNDSRCLAGDTAHTSADDIPMSSPAGPDNVLRRAQLTHEADLLI
ncbi:hypothetical protein KCU65_g9898, partial [Aureobasidium melanogenum]